MNDVMDSEDVCRCSHPRSDHDAGMWACRPESVCGCGAFRFYLSEYMPDPDPEQPEQPDPEQPDPEEGST